MRIQKYRNAIETMDLEYKKKEKQFKELQKLARQKNKETSSLRIKSIINDSRKIENDLEKKQKKLSNFKSRNRELRRMIDNLRKEKNIYKNICVQIHLEIERIKKNISIAGKKLNKLEENKQNIKSKIHKETREKELEYQLTTLGYLTMKKKLKDHDYGFNYFPNKKQMIKTLQEQPNQYKHESEQRNQFTDFSQQNLSYKYPSQKQKSKQNFVKKKSGKFTESKNSLEEIKKEEENLKSDLKEMKMFFDTLYKETNTSTLEDLMQYYTDLEEENQKYYQETKQLIDEIDKTKDKKLSMQIQLKEIIQSKSKKQTMKKKIIDEMKTDLNRLNGKISDIISEKENLKTVVNTLKMSIPVIIERLTIGKKEQTLKSDFNLNEIYEDNGQTIHNKAVPVFLYQLEKRTNQILKLVRDNDLQSRIFDDNNIQTNRNTDENKVNKNHFSNIEEIKSKLKRIAFQ